MDHYLIKAKGRFVNRRLRSIGLTSGHARIASDFVVKTLSTQGLHQGLNHLKEVGTAIGHFLDPAGEKSIWVRLHNRFPAKLNALRDLSPDCLTVLSKIFKCLMLEEATKEQLIKKLEPIVTPITGCNLSELQLNVESGLDYYTQLAPRQFDVDYVPVSKIWKRYASISGTVDGKEKGPQFADAVHHAASNELLRRLPSWESMFWPIHPQLVAKTVEMLIPFSNLETVGKVMWAQEPGGKLRVYAAPYTIYQSALTPVARYVSDFLNTIPNDCRKRQDMGKEFAMQALSKGVTVHSLDLSSATDTFPLSPQLWVLEQLGVPGEFMDLLEFVIKHKWDLHPGAMTSEGAKWFKSRFPSQMIEWENGQPLGITPSYVMFSLTHHCFITGLCLKHGVKPEDTYVVLGDDVAITDALVAADYARIMNEVGVKCSPSKCRVSNRSAEFAGAVIFPSFWVNPGKWREVDYQNYFGISESLSSDLSFEVSRSQATVLRVRLFQYGLYNPPSELWPMYIRAVSENWEIPMGLPRTKTLHESVGPIWELQVNKLLQNFGLEPTKAKIHKALMSPNKPFYNGMNKILYMLCPGEYSTYLNAFFQAATFHNTFSKPCSFNALLMHFMQANMYLDWLFETSRISQSDFVDALRSLKAEAHRNLFCPERNTFDEQVQQEVARFKILKQRLVASEVYTSLASDKMYAISIGRKLSLQELRLAA